MKNDPTIQAAFNMLNTTSLNSKRRFNAMSYNNNDTAKTQPVASLINFKNQSQKMKMYEFSH